MALIFRFRQVFPGSRRLQAKLFTFHCIKADRCYPGIHACPGRRRALVDKFLVELFNTCRCIWLQHTFRFHQQKGCRGQTPDHVGLRIIFFSQQLGSDNTGGVTHPLDLDIRMDLVEFFGIAFQVFCLNRRINSQFACRQITGNQQAPGSCQRYLLKVYHRFALP